MNKYIAISGIAHVLLLVSFIAIKYDNNKDVNNNQNQIISENENTEIIPYINEEKEAIMNAISITEEELNEEILRIQKQDELDNFDKNKKIEILEKSLEMELNNLKRQKELQDSQMANERAEFEDEKRKLNDLHNKIKDQTNSLSEKQRELEQVKREINIKLNESQNKNNELLSEKEKIEKKLSEKDMQIIQQEEIFSQMQSQIAELQTVISKEKEKNNKILEEKTDAEIELLKQELIEYNLTIRNKIEQFWTYSSDQKGISCSIQIIQSNTGEILSVSTNACNGDKYFIESIKEATWKASPLPLPNKESLFSRTINLFFTIK